MPDFQKGKIYTLVNDTNNTIYVGSTAEHYLNARLLGHKHDSLSKQLTSPICTAIRTIGIEHFSIVLHHLFPTNSRRELEDEEYKLLGEYVKAGKPLYNVMLDRVGRKTTAETREKQSKAATGRKCSDAMKAKMVLIARARPPCTAETRLKQSENSYCLGKTGELCHKFTHGVVLCEDKSWRFYSSVNKVKTSKSFSFGKHGYWHAKLMAEDERRKMFPAWKSYEEQEIIDMGMIDWD